MKTTLLTLRIGSQVMGPDYIARVIEQHPLTRTTYLRTQAGRLEQVLMSCDRIVESNEDPVTGTWWTLEDL
jgi:hypothetical protein